MPDFSASSLCPSYSSHLLGLGCSVASRHLHRIRRAFLWGCKSYVAMCLGRMCDKIHLVLSNCDV